MTIIQKIINAITDKRKTQTENEFLISGERMFTFPRANQPISHAFSRVYSCVSLQCNPFLKVQ